VGEFQRAKMQGWCDIAVAVKVAFRLLSYPSQPCLLEETKASTLLPFSPTTSFSLQLFWQLYVFSSYFLNCLILNKYQAGWFTAFIGQIIVTSANGTGREYFLASPK